jgi:type IV pilus assembly protein PilY1
MRATSIFPRILSLALAAMVTAFQGGSALAGPLAITDSPLFLNGSVAPLNLLVMGRDHKLYYEAYNDHTDLDGDGTLDIGYRGYLLNADGTFKINYFGYFDSFKCYAYSTVDNRFNVAAVAPSKTCTNQWSGDWLNYVTMSRLDALRKVLYGGYRSTDTAALTVLERTVIPQDAHSWGKSYESIANDGYDIRLYAPLPLPAASSAHLFANTTPLNTTNPLLRVIQSQQDASGQPLKVWNWLSIERPVADLAVVVGTQANGSENRQPLATAPTDYQVRVRVCDTALGVNTVESNCRPYGATPTYKPTGLLQDFGETDTMKFGLITGSYARNTDGGVLRRQVGSIANEINLANGTFNTGVTGIIQTLNRLRTTGFGTGHEYACGWNVMGPITAGECQMWGNPIGEMMYEGLRYFAGKQMPTALFNSAFGAGEEASLPGGGLPVVTWDDPYSSNPRCAKPFETVISDINPSYDTDKIPGTAFGSGFTGDLSGLNAQSLGQKIWDNEPGLGGTRKIFIGQSGLNSDNAPTAKDVNSLGNIRGLAPEEPTKQGGYYSASVAHHGLITDLNPVNGDQKVSTFAVALASPLPRIEIPVAGRTITLVPFAKTVGGSVNGNTVSPASTSFQPTNQIVDFYVDPTSTPTAGKFRVNYEDVEQGADHDMDAIVLYEYTVKGDGTVDVRLTSQYAAGSLIHHIGYVISGTTRDGTYFEVRDKDTAVANDPDYFLDTPPGFTGTPPAPSAGAGSWDDNIELPLVHTRNFMPGSTPDADVLKDPLWYAAKWGGFQDEDKNNLPNLSTEWDADNDGDPDNYFLVTNALTLNAQLTKAFKDIVARVASASSASVNSGSISSETRVYQAKFNSGDWSGQLLSFPVQPDGTLATTPEWDAAEKIPAPNSRAIITVNNNGTAARFRWSGTASLDTTRKSQLRQSDPSTPLDYGQLRLDYLRGDGAREDRNNNVAPVFRNRPIVPFRNVLGDIVSSAPVFVGKPAFLYRDSLEAAPYSAFRIARANRDKMVYAGANDGMLHVYDAGTGATKGTERLAFIPGQVFKNLHEITKPTYTHRYFVDGTPTVGDAFISGAWRTMLVGGLNKGGQGVYALDITDPSVSNFTEANAANIFKWQFSDVDGDTNTLNNDRDLGYTFSRPAIVRMPNNGATPGKWVAIFGNGYNNTEADGMASTTGRAVLYIVDLATGNLIKKLDTLVGTAQDPLGQARPNGLATPAVIDLNGDSIVDYAYAGDLFGNLWKFKFPDGNTANWDFAYKSGTTPVPLFVATDALGNRQPITTRPEVGRGPRGAGMVVLFGTGKFLELADKNVATLKTQSFYGIIDRNTDITDVVTGRNFLTPQQILVEDNFTFTNPGTDPGAGDDTTVTLPIRVTTANAVGTTRGWYMDLLSGTPGVPPPAGFKGEMQVSDSVLRNGRIIFTTLIPNPDPCDFGGTSWLMEMDALSGARLQQTPFDNNDDGQFDGADMVTVTLPDGTTVTVPISGLKSEVGITPKPGILAGENAEYKYTPGTTGEIQMTVENPGANAMGRQSWRQVR